MSNINALVNTPLQTAQFQAHNNYVDVNGLNGLKQQAREDQKAALKPVAEQFEAIFVQQILKESRKVSFDDGWLDGDQGDFYKDWSDSQLAQNLSSKGTLGFADKIVEQLAPSIPSLAQNKTDAPREHTLKPLDLLNRQQVIQPLAQLDESTLAQTKLDASVQSSSFKMMSVAPINSTEQALALRFNKIR